MAYSDKQRAAYEALRPKTMQCEIEVYVDYALVGELFQMVKLGVELQYGWSFISPMDGLLYHGGTIVRTRPGCGVRKGGQWAYLADKLVKVS